MRVRHRVPSIFSLSMVDVLCCALGCVILLWLLNARQHQDAMDESTRVRDTLVSEAQSERDSREAELVSLRSQRTASSARLAELDRRLAALEAERNTLRTTLAAKAKQAGDLESRWKTAAARVAALEADVVGARSVLAKERARASGLSAALTTAEGRMKSLSGDLEKARAEYSERDKALSSARGDVSRRTQELVQLNARLTDLMLARRTLQLALDARDRELATLHADRLALEKKSRALAAELRDQKVAADRARDSLQVQLKKWRGQAESRFAGIALTGKRVVFLVDISGSMEMLDDKTAAPFKWEEVCATIARLILSLPELEKFQLIVFNNEVAHPLGGAGRWKEIDTKTTALTVRDTLKKIKPKGGTDMYVALEAAFAYRAQGLDTIYLLSDGLPNLGPGLTAAQRRDLTEVERGQRLGAVVRRKLAEDWNRRVLRSRVRINTIGFFYESPDLGAFLWALARENDGSFVGMSRP